MPRFFLETITGPAAVLGSADGRHIRRSLRMRAGDTLTVTDGIADHLCRIERFGEDDTVYLTVESSSPIVSEPALRVTLYQGLPKGDKMEWIIQKAVELGVAAIVPVATSRSVVRLDAAGGAKKQERWQKIAAEAAGQSGRGCIPAVEAPVSFAEAANRMARERTLVFFEGGGAPLRELIAEKDTAPLSIFVGPEGGIAPEELDTLLTGGATAATLGKRILRCETAPLMALSVIMALSGNAE